MTQKQMGNRINQSNTIRTRKRKRVEIIPTHPSFGLAVLGRHNCGAAPWGG